MNKNFLNTLLQTPELWTLSFKQLKQHLEDSLSAKGNLQLIFTPNPEQVVQAEESQQFAQALLQADILLPDGVGLLLASKLLASRLGFRKIEKKITGVQLTQWLLNESKERGLKVLVLGGREYQKLAGIEAEPLNKIGGAFKLSFINRSDKLDFYWSPGYERVKAPQKQEDETIGQLITQIKPDVVFVAFGAPYQEEWLVSHQQALQQVEVKLGVAVGGSFDFILGKVTRAPIVMQRLGLEWFYRLIKQPWRWRRQLRLIKFIKLVWLSFVQAE